jgi:hypothetical protein
MTNCREAMCLVLCQGLPLPFVSDRAYFGKIALALCEREAGFPDYHDVMRPFFGFLLY